MGIAQNAKPGSRESFINPYHKLSKFLIRFILYNFSQTKIRTILNDLTE